MTEDSITYTYCNFKFEILNFKNFKRNDFNN